MGATLHHRAPNTYYGQWPRFFVNERGTDSRANAHNELAAKTLSTCAQDLWDRARPARSDAHVNALDHERAGMRAVRKTRKSDGA